MKILIALALLVGCIDEPPPPGPYPPPPGPNDPPPCDVRPPDPCPHKPPHAT